MQQIVQSFVRLFWAPLPASIARGLQSFGDLGEVADASPKVDELALVDVASADVDDSLVQPFRRREGGSTRIFGAVEALDSADGAPLRGFRH